MTVPDSGCPIKTSSGGTYPTSLPLLWEEGKAQPLPTVGSDPAGFGEGINDRGQVVGYSGTCTTPTHAVLWEHGTASPLADLGIHAAIAYAIDEQSLIVGTVASPGIGGLAALWQNGTIIRPCRGCERRAAALNRWMTFSR